MKTNFNDGRNRRPRYGDLDRNGKPKTHLDYDHNSYPDQVNNRGFEVRDFSKFNRLAEPHFTVNNSEQQRTIETEANDYDKFVNYNYGPANEPRLTNSNEEINHNQKTSFNFNRRGPLKEDSSF